MECIAAQSSRRGSLSGYGSHLSRSSGRAVPECCRCKDPLIDELTNNVARVEADLARAEAEKRKAMTERNQALMERAAAMKKAAEQAAELDEQNRKRKFPLAITGQEGSAPMCLRASTTKRRKVDAIRKEMGHKTVEAYRQELQDKIFETQQAQAQWDERMKELTQRCELLDENIQ